MWHLWRNKKHLDAKNNTWSKFTSNANHRYVLNGRALKRKTKTYAMSRIFSREVESRTIETARTSGAFKDFKLASRRSKLSSLTVNSPVFLSQATTQMGVPTKLVISGQQGCTQERRLFDLNIYHNPVHPIKMELYGSAATAATSLNWTSSVHVPLK